MAYPEYKLHFLSVGDADCMVISYRSSVLTDRKIAVIDAGNVSDSKKIKDFLWDNYRTRKIDLAVCTHPDKDHKGGFFGLMEDRQMTIVDFWYKDPCSVLSFDNFSEGTTEDEAIEICHSIFNHPNDNSNNLLYLAERKCTGEVKSVKDGDRHIDIPITVMGPSEDYYREVAIDMLNDFKEIEDEADFEDYDETALPSDDDAKSVIDEDDDTSATNRSSLILLFNPGRRFLLLGDATCASIKDAMKHHDLTKCTIKVPHHGSKHNLSTEIIEELDIVQSVISAKGSKKHPSSAIVHWLSKYGNVYSTHKSGELIYHSENTRGRVATPLRSKHS